jgi:hypothetical protein
MPFRGSRKHVLELLDRSDYLTTINGLLSSSGAVVSCADPHQPIGFADPSEDELPAFCRKHLGDMIDAACLDVGQWWTLHNGTTPTWDLLSTIAFGGRRALLLVEAKAHALELEVAGKPIRVDASSASRSNHDFIGTCIESASSELSQCQPGFRLARDRHYQLSNRLAWAWKVASCGLPVVLMYLGFTGDTYFARDFLRDDSHWQALMTSYLAEVAPPEFSSAPLVLGSGSVQFLARSLPVRSVSI